MYLKCLENGQFQLLGLLPSVFGVQTAKNEFFQKSFFWTFTTDQNDIQKKGSQYFLRIVTFFCLIPPTPSYIFSIEKRKKSKNRPKRKLKKKIFPQLGILGNFFVCSHDVEDCFSSKIGLLLNNSGFIDFSGRIYWPTTRIIFDTLLLLWLSIKQTPKLKLLQSQLEGSTIQFIR